MNQSIATVSVIIPNYNYGRFISRAIDGVMAQTYSNVEIIVVDDGSTDDSLEILTSYEKKGVKVIQQKNSGVSAARNNGAAKSNGEFIAFLDADDIWLPNKIERQLAAFTDKVGLVTCGMREFDSTSDKTLAYFTWNKTECNAHDLLLLDHPAVSGSAIVVRRSAFDAVKGFDERKEMHASEDWEFCYRVSRVAKIAFLPEVLVAYRNHGGNAHLNVPRYERSMSFAYEKIFQTADEQTLMLRRRCYGNFYRTLAGAYLQTGQYAKFLKYAGKSLFLAPENLPYFASFPIRRLRKQL
jgi:glycosyltransferase involved in cell wall biosynthesis